jgi:hypothetical protein
MLEVAALLVLAPAPTTAKLAGLYEIHQMEMGGALELKADGHFRYAFTYGAVDEESEGDWTWDGKTVRLTSRPMPTEPTFDLVSDAPAPKCTISIAVDWGRFGWSSPPDVLVTYDGAPRELHFVQTDEQGAVHPDNCAIDSVLPLVPMFDIPGAPLKISPSTGHKLSLRFRPNDLGHVAFRAEPLTIDGSGLVMERYHAQIRFIRARP